MVSLSIALSLDVRESVSGWGLDCLWGLSAISEEWAQRDCMLVIG